VGIEHAITVEEAIALHTTMAAELLRETHSRGTVAPGQFADLTIWPRDPRSVENLSELRDLTPTYTIIGGQVKYGAVSAVSK